MLQNFDITVRVAYTTAHHLTSMLTFKSFMSEAIDMLFSAEMNKTLNSRLQLVSWLRYQGIYVISENFKDV